MNSHQRFIYRYMEYLDKHNMDLEDRLKELEPLVEAALKYYYLWLPDHKDADELHVAFASMINEIGVIAAKRKARGVEDG